MNIKKRSSPILPTHMSGQVMHNNIDANSVSRDAQYAELYMAALEGECGAIRRHRNIIGHKITERGETALHIAALARQVGFVEELMKVLSPTKLEIGNEKEIIALCYAAAAGDINIARIMIRKNPTLPNISSGKKPIYLAALSGQNNMVDYLSDKTSICEWSEEEQIQLLTTCIENGLYGTAKKLLGIRPQLALYKDFQALHSLARNPSVFVQRDQSQIWRRMIKSVRGIYSAARDESVRKDAVELLNEIMSHVKKENYLERFRESDQIPSILFKAAETGNIDILIRLIKLSPELLWTVNEKDGSIFQIAVKHRHENIFNLLYELGPIKNLQAQIKSEGENNLLHIAAGEPPSHTLNTVSGAALQMQQEIIWFEVVEKSLPPSARYEENSARKTPAVLFTEKHKELREKGEKWIKDAAKQSMFIATLIATVTFTTAVNFPDGYKSDSVEKPVLLSKTFFKVFIIAGAVALFLSSISILMFLSILTSRFGEKDFRMSLPIRLIVGFMALSLSIAAMTVSFCAALLLYFKSSNLVVKVLLFVLASLPLMHVLLIYSLLKDLVSSTFLYRFRFRPTHQLIQKRAFREREDLR